MIDLKKLLAVGAVTTVGVLACDVEKKDEGDGGAGMTCPAGDGTDATVEATCVDETDGDPTCTCPSAGGAGGTGGAGGSGGGGGAGGVPGDPPPVIKASWNDNGSADTRGDDTFTLQIDDGPANHTYDFGFGQTGTDADPWFGEDCIDGFSNSYDICHDAEADGLTLDAVAMIDELGPDDGTVDTSNGKTIGWSKIKGELTYAVIRDDGKCYTWGDDTSFYIDELQCVDVVVGPIE